MQGKLIKFEPLMINGQQATYNGQNGMVYKFTVTLESGGQQYTGTCNSTKTTPSWKIGEEYTFDHVVNGQYQNIQKLKAVEQAGGKFGGGAKPNPSFVIQKCFEGAVECTLNFFEYNPEYYKDQVTEDKLLTAVYVHILGPAGTSESRRWINLSAMRLAILKMRAKGLFDRDMYKSLTEWLFATAKGIADAMEFTVKTTLDTEKPRNPS